MVCKLLKVQSKKTYVGKDNKEHHYYNYYLEFENGKRIQIQPSYVQDKNGNYVRDSFIALDMAAEFVK